jgi:7-cyano-7-deazaguanine synthase
MAHSLTPPDASAVVVVSGGLDSTTLAYHLIDGGYRLRLMSVDYGQRHRRELDFAVALARRLGVPQDVVDLRSVGRLLAGSALTDATVAVPDGHYTDASMRITVVPNRNALLLDVAVGVAAAHGASAVAFGAHHGDHAIYPDCREEFVAAFEHSARVATEGFVPEGFRVLAPFLTWTKAEIVRRGAQLGVPFADTWSCYRGEAVHCGTCGTCTERREAFALAEVTDPTDYAEA